VVIQALIIDFDGTLVTKDLTDMLSGLVNKTEESRELDHLFHTGKLKGLEGLVRRINFLSGISLEQIREATTKNDYLRVGARELFEYLKSHDIITIIASGSTLPLLEIYQQKLGVDYLVGSKPHVTNGKIISISENDYSGPDFKVRDTKLILDSLGISPSHAVAIGDSPADLGIFELSAKSISINPQYGIEDYCDYVIYDDLSKAIPILVSLSS
jgi:phosphoserine phosphatase